MSIREQKGDDLWGFGAGGLYVAFAKRTEIGFHPPRTFLTTPDGKGHFTENSGWNIGTHTRMFGDINGDGAADLVAYDGQKLYTSLSASPTLRALNRADPFGFAPVKERDWRQKPRPYWLADLTGDGCADLIAWAARELLVYKADGRGGFVNGWTTSSLHQQENWDWRRHFIGFDDLDGDGKADLLALGDEAGYALYSEGEQFTEPSRLWTYWFLAQDGPFALGDVTGDGRADLIRLAECTKKGKWLRFAGMAIAALDPLVRPFASLIRSARPSPVTSPSAKGPSRLWTYWFLAQDGPFALGDVTGDGRADLIRLAKGRTSGSRAAIAIPAKRNHFPFFVHSASASAIQADVPISATGDIDGDGVDELIGFQQTGTRVERLAIPTVGSILMRAEAVAMEPRYARLERLTCHETQDSGEDEIVVRVWVDGLEIARMPHSGERDMNENSGAKSYWDLSSSHKFYDSFKVEIWEIDDTYHERLGTIEGARDEEGRLPLGLFYSFFGEDLGAKFQLRYSVSDHPTNPLPFASAAFDQRFVADFLLEGAMLGGQPALDAITAESDLLSVASDDSALPGGLSTGGSGNARRIEAFWETYKGIVAGETIGAVGLGVMVGITTWSTQITIGITTASSAAAATAATAGAGTSAALAGGAVTAGVVVAIAALVAAVAVPVVYAGQEGAASVQIVNATSHDLRIASIDLPYGLQVYGPDAGTTIGRTHDFVSEGEPTIALSPTASFTFEKEWGTQGIEGTLRLEGDTSALPGGLEIHFDVPFNGYNSCDLGIPRAGESMARTSSSTFERDWQSQPLPGSIVRDELWCTDSNDQIVGYASVFSKDGWTPVYLIVLFDAGNQELVAARNALEAGRL